MGEMIQKPDANPIVFALLNFFVLGGTGYFLMGQKKKAYITWALVFVLPMFTCGSGSIIAIPMIWIAAYDAYKLGQKLQAGDSIGMNENAISFLDMIFKD